MTRTMNDLSSTPTPENAIVCGRARFVLLTDRLVRLEWAEDGQFEDCASLAVVNRALPPVRHTRKESSQTLRLATDGFILDYRDNGRPFSPSNVKVSFVLKGRRVTWTPGSYRNLVVTAYPGGDGEYRLYEDDGISVDYQSGAGAWIPLTQRVEKGARRITVCPAEGRYAGFQAVRSLEVRLPAAVPPTEVTVGGKRLAWAYRLGREGWTYEGQTATVIVRLPRIDLGRQTTIILRQDPAVPASLALGLKGLMARIARVSYYARQATSALIFDREERLGADLEQVGNRVSRNPASLAQERRRLNRLLPALAAMLPRLGHGVSDWEPNINPQRVAVCKKALDILKAAVPELAGGSRRG